MTVPVVAIFEVNVGAEETVEALFRSVIETTLAEEGCITYQLNRDTENPRRFVWTEEWASRELLQKHLEAPHITALFEALPQHLTSSEVMVLSPLAGGKA
ncbi:MAG: putative quinol monooxygenase [Yersiniaceae bacterium]|uniref:Antibiotic biosynthesis monooxygenase n=1 Tax=Chimaeribacter coloradensis TaxID=2060068 RepID=A0A2N5E5H1_9GAMM|nr:putative quinol monooxygenase [Chimaeribacter coloradensis]MDU6409372.1 putative quinol monooxygenase [Yersiniaceae bacterium]PLR36409.1 antibiotic biosynthesis monooxygenase [Chimaeribacter coloradensis]